MCLVRLIEKKDLSKHERSNYNKGVGWKLFLTRKDDKVLRSIVAKEMMILRA